MACDYAKARALEFCEELTANYGPKWIEGLKSALTVVAGQIAQRAGASTATACLDGLATALRPAGEVAPAPVKLPPPPPRATKRRTSKDILEDVCKDHGVTMEDLIGPDRQRFLAYARWDAMARLRAERRMDGTPVYSSAQIGKVLGGRNHSTVLTGIKRWEEVRDSVEGCVNVVDRRHVGLDA